MKTKRMYEGAGIRGLSWWTCLRAWWLRQERKAVEAPRIRGDKGW